MAGNVLKSVVRLVSGLAGRRPDHEAADRILLEKVVAQGDQAAFAALVQRHGPMVLGLCRRLLGNSHDAEDAFQATFLVLFKKARSIGKPELLGNWLYGVAYRTAVRARTQSARRRAREKQVMAGPEVNPPVAADWTDIRPILDEEISRLPDKYRVPFVLCYLEEKSNEETARLLGCPTGTVQSRLARARERLRGRLMQRGLALSAGFLAVDVVIPEAVSAVPPALAASVLQAALWVAGGNATAASPQVIFLMKGVIRAMFWTRIFKSVFVLGLLVIFGTGAGIPVYHALAGGDSEQAISPEPAETAKTDPQKPVDWTAPRKWSTLPEDVDRTAPILRDLVAVKDQLFAVGDKGTFYQYKNGKVTRIASPTEEQLKVVWGLSPDAVYAAGDKGLVVHFDGKKLKVVGQPLATAKFTHHPFIKPYDAPWRVDALWASSPEDIYAAGPGILVHYDGKHWRPVDIGAGQVIVPSSSRLTKAVVTPLVGPIWGTGPNDVWVRREGVEILGPNAKKVGDIPNPKKVGHGFFTLAPVVMHFDGKTWSRTTLTFPEDPTARDAQGYYLPKLSFAADGIWARMDSALYRWQKNQWQRLVSLPGNLCEKWACVGTKIALTFKVRGGLRELYVFANNKWQTIPAPPMALRGTPRRLAVTEDGVIGCLFYGDEGLFKGASAARIYVGQVR